MARASALQQLVHWVEQHPLDHAIQQVERSLNELPRRRLKGIAPWFVAGLTYTVLLTWDWRLTLSTTVGALTVGLVAVGQQRQWRLPVAQLQRGMTLLKQPMVLALGSGTIALLSTYLMISIWAETEQPWLAAGWMAQSLITVALLGVVIALALREPAIPEPQSNWDSVLGDLADPKPLKRLIALRHVLQQATTLPLDQPYAPQAQTSLRSHLVDCLHLMLNSESDPIVRNAVLDALQVLNPVNRLSQGTAPFSPAIAMKQLQRQDPVL